MMDNIDICKCSGCPLRFTEDCIKSEAFLKKTFNQPLRYSICIMKDHIVQSNKLYTGSEEDANEKFVELLRVEYGNLSDGKKPPVDDQCWKEICEMGHFEIGGVHFYLMKFELM